MMDPALLEFSASLNEIANPLEEQPRQPKPYTQAHTKRAAAHNWKTNETTFFLEKYVEMRNLGKYTDGGNLKKEAWTILVNQMNEKFGLTLGKAQLKNKKDSIKQLYIKYEFLRSLSGAGWDEKKQIIIANDEFWDNLKIQHPSAGYEKLRGIQCANYELCTKVFGGTYATGHLARSSPLINATRSPILCVGEDSYESLPSDQGPGKNGKKGSANFKGQPNSSANSSVAPEEGRPSSRSPRPRKKEALVQVLADLGATMEKIMTAPEVPSGGTTSNTHGHENLRLALRILEEEYSTLLTENEYIDCLAILENERKAVVFLAIHKNVSQTLKWFKKA
ncbi:hypothetical protein O181_081706 [Austropuccinia psidii MF-1]|uniref:Myb/SANT-like domain-containing protein n=1 Tax=Austropuccinia psidii MF-1 TaxID=1389203 RepID=A0A9Q3IG77_9BASI|nr:hypothetical protein [Austropuccinia psidii MF-1]